MRYFSILFLVFFFYLSAQAQLPGGKGKVTGTVLDISTKEPVDFATITLFKPGTKTVVGGISSDAKGNFTISGIPAGTYKITIDFIGYKQKVFEPVILSSSTVNLGTIMLDSNVDQLQSVTVTARPPIIENKIDKTIYRKA